MLKKLAFSLLLTFALALSASAADKFVLVIDAGHGGHDAGAVGAISKEKNINLSVALAFGKYVENNCPDVQVIYTRKKDVFVTLDGRAEIANKAKADLFISVHTNSVAKGKTVKGFEVYTLGMHRAADNLDVAKRENSVITMESDYQSRYQGFDPNSAESYIIFEYMQDKNMEKSVDLAKGIQKQACATANRVNKGVHQAGFLVLRETSMPSCLIELGFISNPEEERQLNDATIQDQLARGIYKAFVQYKDKYSGKAPTGTVDVKPAVQPEQPKTEPKAESKQEAKPEPKAEPKVEAKPEQNPASKPEQKPAATDMPVFKVQIVASSRLLKSNDAAFKGLDGVESYLEGTMYKYTVGNSTNYNEVNNLRKQIADKFPQAFVIAFKNGEKVNVNEAIREWKARR